MCVCVCRWGTPWPFTSPVSCSLPWRLGTLSGMFHTSMTVTADTVSLLATTVPRCPHPMRPWWVQVTPQKNWTMIRGDFCRACAIKTESCPPYWITARDATALLVKLIKPKQSFQFLWLKLKINANFNLMLLEQRPNKGPIVLSWSLIQLLECLQVLVGGILAVLLTIFMVQTLLSLATILIGGCFMLDISPEVRSWPFNLCSLIEQAQIMFFLFLSRVKTPIES